MPLSSEDQKLEDRLKSLEGKYDEIIEMLKPIAQTYDTAKTVSRWFWGILVFISVALGIWANWVKIITVFFSKH